MRLKVAFVLGTVGIVAVACGGGVSLGNASSGAQGTSGGTSGDGGDGTSSGGSGTGVKECTSKTSCGPMPGTPAIKCPDGSLGGNTGRCLQTASGDCAWEMRSCPANACFDSAGNLDPSYKKCAAPTDCAVLDYAVSCCGSEHAAGVSKAREAEVQACVAARNAGQPACACPAALPVADDGTHAASGADTPAVTCSSSGLCETSFASGPVCGKTTCTAKQTCCSGMPYPTPTCIDGSVCPVSRRAYKKDIAYLSSEEKQVLHDELLGFPLATYRYKTESEADREHLGFIIDDVAPSPAVVPSGERVDIYGYQTMSVAALQVQAREIADLRREVAELKRACARR